MQESGEGVKEVGETGVGDGVEGALDAVSGVGAAGAVSRLDDAVWIGEQLRRRELPQEMAAFFEGHEEGEAVAVMDAIQTSMRSKVEEGVRKRMAGTAPVVGAANSGQRGTIRRAFGLRH
ncbi:hypothetical protein FACS1894184_01160 [Clostridia bacterium]|nr:hypothetical protein FACS1894184_01160 [Clostridia bacterium]